MLADWIIDDTCQFSFYLVWSSPLNDYLDITSPKYTLHTFEKKIQGVATEIS